MILPLGNLPAAKANRKELLINQIPIKGDAWKNIYIYAHINPQGFVLAVQNVGISAVAQYREMKRVETAFWGVAQIPKHVNS